MLLSTYEHSLDAKSRMIMPSKLREQIGETCVVTKGFDGCLTIYSADEWEKFEKKLAALPQNNPKARKLIRTFGAGAVDIEIDKQGRLLLPAHLREYAGVTKDIVIVGALNKIEVWDKERWNAYNDDNELSLEEAATSLDEFFVG